MQGTCVAMDAPRNISSSTGFHPDRKRILIVEPDESRGAWLRDAVCSDDYSALWIATVSEAWEVLRLEGADLILIAPALGHQSAVAFCDGLHQDPLTAGIPRFILSSFPFALPYQELLDYGIEGIVDRDSTAKDLRRRIAEVLFRLDRGGEFS